MRSVWSRVGRVSCHCHCYACIENRHVHVRRISSAVARIRSGRGGLLAYPDSITSPSTLTPVIRRRRTFSTHLGLWENWAPQRGSKSEGAESVQLAGHANDVVKEEVRRRREEQELKEIASELHSLSIDHWSVDDVVSFEPVPGGRTPPTVPSTTTADPKFMMPQSPWASETLKRQNYSRVWTRKKIAKMETAIARFAVRVCNLLELDSQWPSNLIVLPEAVRPIAKQTADGQKWLEKLLNHRLKELRNKFGIVAQNDPPQAHDDLIPFIPRYSHFEDGLHHELLRDLNTSLVELFDGYRQRQLDLKTLLVKLCHNLLVSSAPPNVQTMNILLLGFYSCDRYLKISSSQARHVILDWLIEICFAVKIRPNEVTCSTILATYRRRGMRHAFARFIMLMRGMGDSPALMYTKELTLTRESAPRLTPTASNPNIFKQAVYPSPMIFAEVIKGVSKFYTLEDAVMVCKDFTAKEWGYDWSCLHYLLNACIIQKDWQSGLWVWDEIKAFRAAGHEEPIRILAGMLALCVQCLKEEMFAEILAYSTKQLKRISQPAFVDIATDVLNRAVERLDDDNLFAMSQDQTTEEDNAEHEGLAFEAQVRRRLKDDPLFRRAVFGLGRDARRAGRARSNYTETFDPALSSEDYEYRTLDLDSDVIEHEDHGERLSKADSGPLPPIDKRDHQNLLTQAEGGDDLEESDLAGATDSDREGRAEDESQHFVSSPMDLDNNVQHDLDVEMRLKSN